MLTSGTVIMIVRLVICDSAVAAWPAPMLATSRSASSCSSLRSRTSSMPPPTPAPRRRESAPAPVGEDGRAAHERRHAREARRTAPPRCPAVPASASTTSAARRSPISRMTVGARGGAGRGWLPDQVPQVHRRDHLVAHHAAPPGRAPPSPTAGRTPPSPPRRRAAPRSARPPALGQQRPHDRQRERHPDGERRAPPQLAPDLDASRRARGPGSPPRPRRPRGPTRRSPPRRC